MKYPLQTYTQALFGECPPEIAEKARASGDPRKFIEEFREEYFRKVLEVLDPWIMNPNSQMVMDRAKAPNKAFFWLMNHGGRTYASNGRVSVSLPGTYEQFTDFDLSMLDRKDNGEEPEEITLKELQENRSIWADRWFVWEGWLEQLQATFMHADFLGGDVLTIYNNRESQYRIYIDCDPLKIVIACRSRS